MEFACIDFCGLDANFWISALVSGEQFRIIYGFFVIT